jgi:hypothetical protein
MRGRRAQIHVIRSVLLFPAACGVGDGRCGCSPRWQQVVVAHGHGIGCGQSWGVRGLLPASLPPTAVILERRSVPLLVALGVGGAWGPRSFTGWGLLNYT